MSNIEKARSQYIGTIKAQLQKVAKFDIGEQIKASPGASALLGEHRTDVETAIAHAKEWLTINWMRIPSMRLQSIVQHIKKMSNSIGRIDADAGAGIAELVDGFEQALNEIGPWLPAVDPARDDFTTKLARVVKEADFAHGQIDAIVSEAKRELEEVKATHLAAQAQTAELAIAEFVKSFSTEADEDEKSARFWLKTMVLLGGVALAAFIAHALVVGRPAEFTSPINAERILLAVVGYLAVVWCGRNYKASMHLASVNRHRANALNTFETFVKSAQGDKETKNAVLLEACRCIFAPSVTGFLGAEESMPTTPLADAVRSVAKGS